MNEGDRLSEPWKKEGQKRQMAPMLAEPNQGALIDLSL